MPAVGIKKGDAAIILPNMIPTVVAYYAIHRLGGIVVLNNPTYSDRELEHQLNDSGAKIMIIIDLLANRMIDLRPKTKVKQIIITSIGDLDCSSGHPLPAGRQEKGPLPSKPMKPASDVLKWKDCIAKSQPNPPRVKLTFDDIAMSAYWHDRRFRGGVILTPAISARCSRFAPLVPKFTTLHVNLGVALLSMFSACPSG